MDNTRFGKKISIKILISVLLTLFFVCGASAGEIMTSVSYNPEEITINNSGSSILVQLAQCKRIISDKNEPFPVQDFFIVLPPSGFVTKITISGHKVISIPIGKQKNIKTVNKSSNNGKRVEYLGEQWINGKNLGVIRVYPVQYGDNGESLLLSTDLKFKIKYKTTRRRVI